MSDEPPVIRNVEYGVVGSTCLLLDVYDRSVSDAADRARATIVLIHGGYIVFTPNYREAPDATFPASRDDVQAAARWALASDPTPSREAHARPECTPPVSLRPRSAAQPYTVDRADRS